MLFFFLAAATGVSITDKASVIFGGSDEPCALGNLYSIGAIGIESNGAIQVSTFLEQSEFFLYGEM